MKALTRFFFLLILLIVAYRATAQTESEGKKTVYFQIGASGGFSPDFPKTILIPRLGVDATFGRFGFRADGQFFTSAPEFDIKSYLDPISSVLTISNQKEDNSNLLLGINPYLNLVKNAFGIQPGIGLKYLMQNGATANAVYNQPPGTSILKFPDGAAKRNTVMLEPNLRVSFGRPGKFLMFYIEGGYTIPVGKNEFTYTSRSLINIIDPRGNIDLKALLNSKEVTATGKAMPSYASIGAGLEIKLFPGKGQEKSRTDLSVNNYGINDEGIKRTINVPSQSELHEVRPLVMLPKEAERQPVKGNSVEFAWQVQNEEGCGQLQYEFSLFDSKGTDAQPEQDILFFGGEERPVYKKLLAEKSLGNKGNGILTYQIGKNELPMLFEEGTQFRWQVKALDAAGNFPQCAWGGNNIVQSNYKSYDCGIKVLIDTILCSSTPPPSGFANYEIKFRIENISGSDCPPGNNAVFNGNTNYVNGSNIKITNLSGQPIPGMSFSAVNPLIGLSLPIGQTSNLYSITMSLPSNSGISGLRLHAWPTYVSDPAYGAAYDDRNLPPCGCDSCRYVQITLNTPQKPPLESLPHSGYDVVSFPVSITYAPWRVNRIVAEVVAFEHTVNHASCITCNTDNRMLGTFVGTAMNHMNGNNSLWMASGNAFLHSSTGEFSREATWAAVSSNGVLLTNQEIFLNMGVPVMNSLNCCQDRIKWTIRFSFVSDDLNTGECRVCEITKSYCLVRTGTESARSLNCRELPVPMPVPSPLKKAR